MFTVSLNASDYWPVKAAARRSPLAGWLSPDPRERVALNATYRPNPRPKGYILGAHGSILRVLEKELKSSEPVSLLFLRTEKPKPIWGNSTQKPKVKKYFWMSF